MFKKLFNFGEDDSPSAADTVRYPSAKEVIALDKKVDDMAATMTPQQGVLWAGKSTEMVKDVTPPDDMMAAEAALTFARLPTEDARKKAVKAAKAVEAPGPGVMAAQAAGLVPVSEPAKDPGGILKMATAAVAPLVAGAVKLAAAMKADPAKVVKAALPMPKVDLKAPEMPKAPQLDPALVMPSEQALQQLGGEQLAKSAQALEPFLKLGESIQRGQITA